MRSRTQFIIAELKSQENVRYIYHGILGAAIDIPEDIVKTHINTHLRPQLDHYLRRVEQELFMSDPLPGISARYEIRMLLDKFINEQIRFISSGDACPVVYGVGDDHMLSTQRVSPGVTADSMLSRWKDTPAKSVQLREDQAGDTYRSNYTSHGDSAIIFCDQSSIGVNSHYSRYENRQMYVDLNATPREHERFIVGESNTASDGRLLDRRIFRNGNNISQYEHRLHRRNVDRDIDEGLSGDSRGAIQYSHDMSQLYTAVDEKTKQRHQFEKKYPMVSNIQYDTNPESRYQ